MAEATRVPIADVPTEIHLVLSDREATALRYVLQRVGGDPNSTPRGLLNDEPNSIDGALARLGVDKDKLEWNSSSGSIYFKEAT